MRDVRIICPFCACPVHVRAHLPLAVLLSKRNLLDWGRDKLEESGHLAEHAAEMIVAARRG